MSEVETAIELVGEQDGVQHWSARRDARAMRFELVDGRGPFALDEDLGSFIGYSRARDGRGLVKRMIRQGKYKESELCEAPSQLRRHPGRQARGYLLTRAQAVYAIMQSRAPDAIGLQRDFTAMLDSLERVLQQRAAAPAAAPALAAPPLDVRPVSIPGELSPREDLALARARLRQVAAFDRAVKAHRVVATLTPWQQAQAERFRAELAVGRALSLPALPPAAESPPVLAAVLTQRAPLADLPAAPAAVPVVATSPTAPAAPFEFASAERRAAPPAVPEGFVNPTWPPVVALVPKPMRCAEIARLIGFGCSANYVGRAAEALGLHADETLCRIYTAVVHEDRKVTGYDYLPEGVRKLIAYVVAHPSAPMRRRIRQFHRAQSQLSLPPAPSAHAGA